MLALDSLKMSRHMNHVEGFDRVLHVAHQEWHGIRQATAYCPGHKLLISAHNELSKDECDGIVDAIADRGFDRVVFQGFSEQADRLLLELKGRFGSDLACHAITHVTTAQFDNYFEMTMQARLFMRRRFGMLSGLASVKPGFHHVFDEYWPGLILNFAPNLPEGSFERLSDSVDVYTPLDPGWRKNMYTNILAALMAGNVDHVKTANFPNGLESLHDMERLRVVGYKRGDDLLGEMADSSLVILATLAECQPTTQLEAFAVGTPALTGPLFIEDFSEDPLIDLCTTDKLDNPALLVKDIERVVAAQRSDPLGMKEMISTHLDARQKLAADRYSEFLEL